MLAKSAGMAEVILPRRGSPVIKRKPRDAGKFVTDMCKQFHHGLAA
jgi:hypothetical protein